MLGQILLVILIILAWIGARSLLQKRLDGPGSGGGRQGRDEGDGEVEEMTRCAHCRVFIPRSQAVYGNGRPYCSEAHRRAGPARG